jgi:hypothetical protein
MVVFAGIMIYTLLKGSKAGITVTVLIPASALSVILLFVSGGLLSNENTMNVLMFNIHNITTITALVSMGVLFCLLVR